MRKIALLALMALATAGAFAEGQNETDQTTPWGGTGDEVTLTGTVTWEDGHPELVSDGTTYALAAPGAQWYRDEIPEGTAVTVEGTTFDPGPRALQPNEVHVLVEKITVDGETYELDELGFGRGGFGMRGSGPMMGRGGHPNGGWGGRNRTPGNGMGGAAPRGWRS